ncbi:metallophosphoesterase family protein [Infirmifilum lucidum]|uniref:Metallophosphoesterase family protein n=1 Tax=Infirmifilum lucidum TaxID=2776706 RepID=A0A7L9FFA0_9CREN|nr:metallophosphoesterase family protein [Infirmifilum lucidum]QOJ78478.1 metallophosphoesterase family protein [Infirmifilum lucidum]
MGGKELALPCRRALIFSDTHCKRGRPCSPVLEVLGAAKEENVDCIAILGDLFDDFHVDVDPATLALEMARLGFSTYSPRYVLYTPSLSSHDPILGEAEFNLGGTVIHVARVINIGLGGEEVCLTHGDIVVPNGAIAYFVNRTMAILGKSLFLEEQARKRLCGRSSWLFMGHTHIPGLDHERRLGNPGSWRATWHSRMPYWRRPSNSFVLYDGKRFRLVFS